MGRDIQDDRSLFEKLSAYGNSDYYPCHMPGHKRSRKSGEMADFYRLDITEIDGFDNLHHAEGIIRDAQERAGRLYGAEETYYLINGSTCGVLASVLAAAGPGDEILIARNCHKSVYHAAILQGINLRYYYPKQIEEYDIYDGVDAEEIGRLLDAYPKCRAVVITSPTYEGIISDICAVAKAVHDRNKILIVDEAHGAHLISQGAVSAGADLVIHSLHKTLPAMTQTALLHAGGKRVDRKKLKKYLSMLQSSSPSYVLMASMDSCVRYVEEHGAGRAFFLREQYNEFCRRVDRCRHIRIGKMKDVSGQGYLLKDWDIGKVLISVKGTSVDGQTLYDILRDEYHLQMEMAAGTYVLAMMTMMDSEEGWQRLADALLQIDDRIERKAAISVKTADYTPKAVMGIADAFHMDSETVSLSEAADRIAADFINLYPPGVPLLVPGEIIEEKLLLQIRDSLKMGLNVQGITEDGKISVIVSL